MPFGGLLTVGLISAGASLGSSAIGGNSQKKAGALLDKRAQEVGGAIDKATGGAIKAGYDGMGQANTALDTGLSTSTDTINSGVTAANGVLGNAASMFDPYRAVGTQGATGMSDMLAGAKPVTMSDLQMDPGFEFRMLQGQKALERSAAARGSVMGGGTLKSLTRYGQGVASDEYQKAFDRFQTDRNARWGMASGAAGMGLNATDRASTLTAMQGGNLMHGADLISNNQMNSAGTKANVAMNGNQFVGSIGLRGAESAGNARMGGASGAANGITGSGNAWANGVNNIGGSVSDMLLYKMLSQPTGGGGIGAIDRTIQP